MDDADLCVVDDELDPGFFVGAADADVVHFQVVSQRDDAGVIDAVLADAPVSVGAGGGRFAARGVGNRRGAALQ